MIPGHDAWHVGNVVPPEETCAHALSTQANCCSPHAAAQDEADTPPEEIWEHALLMQL